MMAEPSNTIFNKKALDKIYSTDDLNRSLRVVGSGFWAALCACAVFIAGFFIWAILFSSILQYGNCEKKIKFLHVGSNLWGRFLWPGRSTP